MNKIYLEIIVRNRHRKVIASNQRLIKVNAEKNADLTAVIDAQKISSDLILGNGKEAIIEQEIIIKLN